MKSAKGAEMKPNSAQSFTLRNSYFSSALNSTSVRSTIFKVSCCIAPTCSG